MSCLFNQLKIKQHPNKTFIGRISTGFDFIGYYFSFAPLQLATVTIKKFVLHIFRLYEQQSTADNTAALLEQYVKRWLRWTWAGLSDTPINLLGTTLFALKPPHDQQACQQQTK